MASKINRMAAPPSSGKGFLPETPDQRRIRSSVNKQHRWTVRQDRRMNDCNCYHGRSMAHHRLQNHRVNYVSTQHWARRGGNASRLSGSPSVVALYCTQCHRPRVPEFFLDWNTDILAQDVVRGMREAASRGFLLASNAPFGYKRVKVNDGGRSGPRWRLTRPQPPW